jgi:hypothetical protein
MERNATKDERDRQVVANIFCKIFDDKKKLLFYKKSLISAAKNKFISFN